MPPLELRRAATEYVSKLKLSTEEKLKVVKAFIDGALWQSQVKEQGPIIIQQGVSIGISFEQVWNAYDRKDAKQNAIKAWNKLSPKEQMQVAQHLSGFVKAHPDKKFRPMFATYLNQKRFLDDEIVSNSPNNIFSQNEQQQQRLSAYASAIATIDTD